MRSVTANYNSFNLLNGSVFDSVLNMGKPLHDVYTTFLDRGNSSDRKGCGNSIFCLYINLFYNFIIIVTSVFSGFPHATSFLIA